MSLSAAFDVLLLVGPSLAADYPGAIRSQFSGKCWDLPGGDFQNGNEIWQWDCAGTDNQRFSWDPASFTLSLTTSPDKCVDVNGADYSNGNPIQIWDCVGSPQQLLGFDDNFGTIYFGDTSSDASKCVDILYYQHDNGSPVGIWDCDGQSNQQFWYTPDTGPAPPPPPTPDSPVSYIKSRETGNCLDVPGGNTNAGQELWIWSCDNSPNQQWLFSGGSIVLNSDQSKCVDLKGGDTTDGNKLQLWDCNDTPQQGFGIDDSTHLIYMTQVAKKCFQMQDGSGLDGVPLEIWKCLPYGNQQWYLETVTSDAVV